ncbi:hypothetical protein AAU57_12870 [Nonlabens sp. YIK11]|uniref:glycosyltransferase family 4 protein n=1 Tax=Nonlabens sp. YIK11 TaxID=1453349 RepID=UPI0006DC0D8F|nr:glycosyltransferase family 4 protein [Nonlabens sp. YIK11]KQC34126.1 hypothetical protein AAU57_12870 [Nonlabens sp. YIK11]
MRILQIIDSLHPGGAERMAVQIANALTEKVELSALCCTREEGVLKEQLDNEVAYRFANRKGRIGISGIARMHKFVQNLKITHIHAHGTSCYTAFLLKILNPHLKLIWHDHYGNAEMLDQRPTRLLRIMAKKMDAIIVVNEQLERWARQLKPKGNVFFLANFSVKDSIFPETEDRIPGNHSQRVVCLANLRPQKNHPMLLEVWRDIVSLHPDWSLLLVGMDFQDQYSQNLQKFITQNQLQDRVFMLGTRTDVADILKQCQIGVLSSKSEGLPLSLLEYGNAGLPVVATNVGACKQVIGDDGFIAELESPSVFKKYLLDLINDPALRSEIGLKFQKRIEKKYSQQPYLTTLSQIYSSL